jgi:hypothetical protein
MSLDLSGSEFEFFRQKILRGDVVLFLGAGFSADATNVTGGTLPLGRNLAKLLAEKAGFPYDGEPLPSVYQAVRPRIGDNQLWAYLNELYDVKGYADWYKILPQFVWHRIYTINIDNLVDRIYLNSSTQVLTKLVCPTQIAERDPHFEKLQCIHLHGHVEYRQQGIVFSLSEFAQQTAGPNPWYQQLAEDLFTRPLLFVGTPMEEPMLYHYIELRGLSSDLAEIRPKSFLVNRTISEITRNSYLERNIHPIQADGKTFFETLAASVDLQAYSVSAVRNTVYPHITFQRNKGVSNPNIDRYFDLIIANALPPSPQMPPGAFFMGGEPTWADIDKRHDAAREIGDEFKTSVLAAAQTPSVVVLYGPAGSGKTTTMMRTAVELAADGKTVFFGKGDERIDLEGIVQLSRSRVAAGDMTRIYVFIDIISRHMGSVDILKHEISKGLPITLVVADRANSYFNKCQVLVTFNAHEVTMPDLTEADIVAVLERLERFGFLGVLRQKTHPERVRMFMDVAQKQMLVAMREATSGRGFDSILRSEFGELGHDAKLAYTITALAVAKGSPGVYRRHLMPALGATDYAKHRIIDELLRGVLVRANQTGTLLKPRHRLIANLIADEIAPTGLKVEAVTTLLADPPWLCVHCFLMPLCKSPRIDQPIGEFFAGKNRAARNGKTWLQNSPENQGNSNLGRSRH